MSEQPLCGPLNWPQPVSERWCACQSQPGQFGPWHPWGDTDWCPENAPIDFDALCRRDEESALWGALDNGSGEVPWAMGR